MSKLRVVCNGCGVELASFIKAGFDETVHVWCSRCQPKDDVRPDEETPEAIVGVARTLSEHLAVLAATKKQAQAVLALGKSASLESVTLLIKGYISVLELLEEISRTVK